MICRPHRVHADLNFIAPELAAVGGEPGFSLPEIELRGRQFPQGCADDGDEVFRKLRAVFVDSPPVLRVQLEHHFEGALNHRSGVRVR